MMDLTYNDYLSYLKVKFDSFQESQLSPEEVDVYKRVKETLSEAASLPKYVLESSLLDSIDLDEETLEAVVEIKKTISAKNNLGRNIQVFMNKINEVFLTLFYSRKFVNIMLGLVFISVMYFAFFFGAPIPVDTSPENGLGLSGSASAVSSSLATPLVVSVLCVLIFLLLNDNKKK